MHLLCPQCQVVNRIPEDRPPSGPNCGRCGKPLYDDHPFDLDESNLSKHLARDKIPLLVDFWAEWCGPCKAMTPVLSQAAAQLKPEVRVAKVETDRNPALAARYAIRTIPTLVLFRRGTEKVRVSGAMNLRRLLR